MFCSACGNQLPDNCNFCGKCGTKVQNQTAPMPEPIPLSPANSAVTPVSVSDTGAAEVNTSASFPSVFGLKCPQCGSDFLLCTGTDGAMGAATASYLAFGAIGSIVANSIAQGNFKTEPLKYKCCSCNNKFSTLPLVADQQEILPAPCMVNINRPAGVVGCGVTYFAYLNGIKIGALKNAGTISIQTNVLHNTVIVTDQFGVAFKDSYSFIAQPGGYVNIAFNRKFIR